MRVVSDLCPQGKACVVDEDVDLGELSGKCRGKGLRLRRVPHVHHHQVHLDAGIGSD